LLIRKKISVIFIKCVANVGPKVTEQILEIERESIRSHSGELTFEKAWRWWR
jgi:hypothetical protein